MRHLTGLDFIREKVRKRDNWTCQSCGKKWVTGTRRFDVHHIETHLESVKDYQYEKRNLDKLITLCHRCHLRLPHNRDKLSPLKERNKRIVELVEKKFSYTTIAKTEGISRQRVTEIYLREKSYPQR